MSELTPEDYFFTLPEVQDVLLSRSKDNCKGGLVCDAPMSNEDMLAVIEYTQKNSCISGEMVNASDILRLIRESKDGTAT